MDDSAFRMIFKNDENLLNPFLIKNHFRQFGLINFWDMVFDQAFDAVNVLVLYFAVLFFNFRLKSQYFCFELIFGSCCLTVDLFFVVQPRSNILIF